MRKKNNRIGKRMALRATPNLPPIKSYHDKVQTLAAVAAFDAKAFVGDDDCPKHICNFVAALAVAHNDLNDISLAFELRATQGPFPETGLTRERGLAGGIGLHLVKLRTAVLHELLILVEESKKTISHEWFKALVAGMHVKNREHWQSIELAAAGRAERTPLGIFLSHARDKVAFHYDQKIIGIAFRKRFVEGNEPPCFSKGIHSGATRFYFADAAVEEAMFPNDDGSALRNAFATGEAELFSSIDHALNSVITRFLKLRDANPRILDVADGSAPPGLQTTSDGF